MTPEPPSPVDPATTALLVMDYQNGLFGRIDDGDALLAGAQQTIALIRDRGGHIGYVRVGFADGEVPSGTLGQRIGRGSLGVSEVEVGEVDAVGSSDGHAVDSRLELSIWTEHGAEVHHRHLRTRRRHPHSR